MPTHNPNVCIRILQLNTANPFRRSVMAGPSLLQPPPCRGGVISVHHDPVHGICTNPGNREWVPYPLSFFVVCAYPVYRVMVNWDPPISQYLFTSKTLSTTKREADKKKRIFLERSAEAVLWAQRVHQGIATTELGEGKRGRYCSGVPLSQKQLWTYGHYT